MSQRTTLLVYKLFTKAKEALQVFAGPHLLAEREGFEPSIRFPAYTLSKRAPSATRPPLHKVRRNLAKGATKYKLYSLKALGFFHPFFDRLCALSVTAQTDARKMAK